MRSLLFIIGVVFSVLVLPASAARAQGSSQVVGDVKLADTIFLASQGNMDAQFQVGRAYFTGQGVALDKTAATSFFKMAAEQGHTTSESLMGAFYSYGEGVEIDYAQSMKWYRRAAIKGNAPSQLGLGGLYKEGLGVLKNDITAYAWYAISTGLRDNASAEVKAAFEKDMTQEGVVAAQKLAIQCLLSEYKNCG